jgi:hypothetical protein
MLGGVPVPTAWCGWRNGLQLRIYFISCRGQITRGGPPAWGLGVGLITPNRKKKLVTKTSKEPRTWIDSVDKQPKLWNTDMRFILER